jgi:nicotinate-nucleotide pyrophosphorylase (carboxylating)
MEKSDLKNTAMSKFPLPDDIATVVKRALIEDVGTGDITAQLIPTTTQARAQVISREPAILCGTAWFDEVYQQLDPKTTVVWYAHDGDLVQPKQVLCEVDGEARTLLTGERNGLNFIQLLSGIATQTYRFVQAVQGSNTQILDTRKTLPGLRKAQKYAVRCGGGKNHRMGLYDAFLIKENHILAAGSITQAMHNARQLAPHLPIEVEVETLAQIEEALQAQVESLLLDNFNLDMLKEAVRLVDGRATLEASGGITLQSIKIIAETGINFISVGSLTKDVKAIDLSMRML